MRFIHSRPVHRSFTFLLGILFATVTTTPINAQPRVRVVAQMPATENTMTDKKEPRQAFAGQLAVFLGHEAGLNDAVFSPDGRQIFTASEDKTARLWDIQGNLVKEFRGHEYPVKSAVFNPDGSQILTIGDDYTARLWDIKGNLVKEFREADDPSHATSSVVKSAIFSPDGTQILTLINFSDKAGVWDKFRLWDSKGNLLKEFQRDKAVRHDLQSMRRTAVFSPDSRQILTVGSDRIARLLDSKGNLLQEFQGHQDGIVGAVFSPDGRQILTASSDQTARLWDTQGNVLAVFQGHEKWVESAVFSPDGRQILTTNIKNVRLWDTKGNLLAVFGQHGDSDWSKGDEAVFSPDGSQILTSSRDGTAQVWDTKGNLLTKLRGHEGFVRAVFSPDGRQILTFGGDKIARLWDVSAAIAAESEQMAAKQNLEKSVAKNNAQLAVFREHKESVYRAVFSPDGRQILTATQNKISLWDTKGNLLAEFQERGASAIFSPDGSQILTIGAGGHATEGKWEGTTRLWDTEGNLLAELRGSKSLIILSAAFSPDGRLIVTAGSKFGGGSYSARLWDLKGNLLVELRSPPLERGWRGIVTSAVFSPDGTQILTASDEIARLWDIKGNLLVEFRGHEKRVNSAEFSPDGKQILTASKDETARLWDIKGNLLVEFRGHKGEVWSAVFSPDGKQILTYAWGEPARLWDIQGNLLAEFRGEEGLKSAKFSPDGSQILTTSDANGIDPGIAHLWDTKGNLLAVFRGHERGFRAVFSPDGGQILTASEDGTVRLWEVSVAIAAQAEQMAARETSQASVSENNDPQAAAAFQEGIQLSQQGTIESRQQAIQKLQESLKLYRADKNLEKEALTLLSTGNIYADLGQFQNALNSYNQALPLSQQAGATAAQADILNSLGQLYNELADSKTALTYFNQALPLYYQLSNPGAVATIFNNIGEIQTTSEDRQKALKSYNQALIVSRPAGDLAAEASALMGIGKVYIASENWTTALNAYSQALLICRHLNDKIKETTILNQIGRIQAAVGEISQAATSYNQALSLSQQLGYKTEEANILYNQAVLNRQQNNLTVAKTEIETAINIIENLRTQIASQELRQSYFARNQDYYKFYIDLLMQLHQQDPNKGYDAEALHISERARARSLLELLTEATAEIRSGVDPKLLEKEQNLQQQLNALEHQKYQLISGSYSETELDEIKQKIESTLAQLDQIEAQIRISSPRYADLKYPEPLTVPEIQQQVLDEETVLLEYALGEEQSYLWMVTKNSLNSYILPKETDIENTVKTYRDAVTLDSTAKIEIGLSLSQMLLEPVISQLETKRLLMVGDGILQTIPFAALPLPTSPNTPLLVSNEIVTLPSASTVVIQRRQLENRPLAAKTLAVLADPVFNLKDQRIAGTSTADTSRNFALTRAARNLGIEEGPVILAQLPYTRAEGEEILSLVPESQRLQAFDFDASRQLATSSTLADYQMIHLATHGLLDPINPELSGIVLSLFDKIGQPQDGFLRLHDIFNLNLPVELVVLSACQTGLGEVVNGEGLVGLTRGFMYAGARRVVVSLWSVNDSATAELMSEFYQKMLNEKQEPVSALRAAQLEMWKAGKSPYYWAAFTVQGDWR